MSKLLVFGMVLFVLVACLAAQAGREEALQINGDHSVHTTMPRKSKHMHAEAKVSVQSSEAEPYDQNAGPTLLEIRLHETFTGNIEGESLVRALEVSNDVHSSRLASMQRFHGKLGGRQGTFVLQGSEIVELGNITAKWFVVPESGTGELSGLRGEGGFKGRFGKGSDGTLDYWFE